ncbi:MAG: cob(I)yrinic acid a,c-diamide adenosyltransferase [Gammaproteobacteria bacterium]|nr:cob(I)yrinic acid a,c-diamide adenosyltransferase [Gammaproteobacteria bacterium]
MNNTIDLKQRHAQRMARKKQVIDERIAKATIEKGVVIVNTGIGKGKSSAGFGVVARALGHGQRVGIVQFIKGQQASGETLFFRQQENVELHVMGDGFTWETQDLDKDIASAQQAWTIAVNMLTNDNIQLVLLDELNIALKHRYIELDTVLDVLEQRPKSQHVIITGRAAPQALIDAADTVTDMGLLKHAFKSGIKAQIGIEF